MAAAREESLVFSCRGFLEAEFCSGAGRFVSFVEVVVDIPLAAVVPDDVALEEHAPFDGFPFRVVFFGGGGCCCCCL